MDNVFIERLWRSLKYQCVFLNAFETGGEARTAIGRWIDFYNRASEHPSVYAIEVNRLCWLGSGPAGRLALRRARSV
jgi:hypothetical protein